MRRPIVLVLLFAVLFQGCASARAGTRAPDQVDFQDLNEELEGEPATVELTSGELIQKAQAVRLGPQTTSWRDAGGRERTVPTAEVRRVLHLQRRMAGKGFGYGAAAISLPAVLVVAKNPSEGAVLASLLALPLGGLIGMAIAVGGRHEVAVYTALAAPASAPAAKPNATGTLHCHLTPGAHENRLDCTPAAR